ESKSTMRFQKALHRVRCDAALAPDWLVNVLQTYAGSGRLSEYFTGTGIAHLTGVSLSRVPIPLPPIEEQLEIVRILDDLWALVDAIDRKLATTLRAVDRSGQAVLANASRGELVA